MPGRSLRRRWTARLAALFLGLLGGLLVAELLLQLGALYIGATERQQAATWRTAGRRVVCLGDSNMYGLWMERTQTFPSYLQQVWNAAAPEQPVEVLNLGFPGLNSSKMRKSFRALMQGLRPNLVLVLVGSNDINSVPVPIEDDAGDRLPYAVWQHSRVFRLLYMLATGMHDRRAQQVEVEVDYTAEHRRGVVRMGDTELDLAGTDRVTGSVEGWPRALEANLRAMAADAAEVGAAFVILTYPSQQSLYGSANQVLAGVRRLPRIDLARAFRTVCPDGRCPDLFLSDQHPNVIGYQLMAAIVFAELYARGLATGHDVEGIFAGLDPTVQDYFLAATQPEID